jgi:threonine synthase
MDVGNPSNMERLQNLLGDAAALNQVVSVLSVSDQDIENEIRTVYNDYGLTICPHTATAMHAYHQMSGIERTSDDWIVVATAHAAKFESIVEPLIGISIPLPKGLSDIMSRPSRFTRIDADMKSLETQLDLIPATGDK